MKENQTEQPKGTFVLLNLFQTRKGRLPLSTKYLTASSTFHEISHCIFHEWHLDLPKKVEEKVTLALESGFTAFAEDHQRVFQEIVKNMGKKL